MLHDIYPASSAACDLVTTSASRKRDSSVLKLLLLLPPLLCSRLWPSKTDALLLAALLAAAGIQHLCKQPSCQHWASQCRLDKLLHISCTGRRVQLKLLNFAEYNGSTSRLLHSLSCGRPTAKYQSIWLHSQLTEGTLTPSCWLTWLMARCKFT